MEDGILISSQAVSSSSTSRWASSNGLKLLSMDFVAAMTTIDDARRSLSLVRSMTLHSASASRIALTSPSRVRLREVHRVRMSNSAIVRTPGQEYAPGHFYGVGRILEFLSGDKSSERGRFIFATRVTRTIDYSTTSSQISARRLGQF